MAIETGTIRIAGTMLAIAIAIFYFVVTPVLSKIKKYPKVRKFCIFIFGFLAIIYGIFQLAPGLADLTNFISSNIN